MNHDNQNKQKVQKTLNNQNDANEPITFLPQHGHYTIYKHTIAAYPRPLPAFFLSTRFVEKKYCLDSLIFQCFLVFLQVKQFYC